MIAANINKQRKLASSTAPRTWSGDARHTTGTLAGPDVPHAVSYRPRSPYATTYHITLYIHIYENIINCSDKDFYSDNKIQKYLVNTCH